MMIENHERVGALLQATLTELTDLALTGKQAHWNVAGPNFAPVHAQLDTLVDDARAAADEVAERAVAIGYSPDARPSTVAKETPLPEFPAGRVTDTDAVRLVTDRLRQVADAVRARATTAGDDDLVSQDLLISVTATLDKHAWMFGAQVV